MVYIPVLLNHPCLVQLGNGGFEFGIPLLAETACQRFFQKFIHGQSQFLAFGACCLADAPAVIVEAGQAVGKFLFADRVESAAYGLAELCLAGAVSLF